MDSDQSLYTSGPPVCVHIVGRSDVGMTRRSSERISLAQRVDELRSSSASERRMLLTRRHDEPGTENPNPESMPLVGLFAKLASEGLSSDPDLELWLVATDQDPSHPEDTHRLAKLIKSTLQSEPDMYGPVLEQRRIRVLVCRDMTVRSYRHAVYRALRRHRPSAVYLDENPGAKTGTFGLFAACAEHGVLPQWVGTLTDAPPVHGGIERNLTQWLVRTRHYDILADWMLGQDSSRTGNGAAEPPKSADRLNGIHWSLLAAWQQMDWDSISFWQGQHKGLCGGSCPLREALTAPPTADDELGSEAFSALVAAADSSIRDRLEQGEPISATFAILPWITFKFAEKFQETSLQTAHAHLRDLMQNAGTAPPTEDEKKFKKDFAKVWAAAASPKHDLSKLKPEKIYGELADLPGYLRPDGTGAKRWLGQVDELAGCASPYNLRSESHTLVALCVGTRMSGGGASPQIEAVLGALSGGSAPALAGEEAGAGTSPIRLALVASPETVVEAERLAKLASRDPRVVSSFVVQSPPRDMVQARQRIEEDLASRLGGKRLERVVVALGPGTTDMAVGLFYAGLGFSLANAVALEVLHLRQADPSSSAESLVDSLNRSIPARLAHDSNVSELVTEALTRCRLGAAKKLCAVGSARWDPLARDIGLLHDALIGARDPGSAAMRQFLGPLPKTPHPLLALLPAQLELFARMAEFDRRTAIVGACAATDGAYEQRLPGNKRASSATRLREVLSPTSNVAPKPWAARSASREPNAPTSRTSMMAPKLWGWRNHVLHMPWKPLPSAEAVKEEIRVLRAKSKTEEAGRGVNYNLLVSKLDSLRERAKRLDPERVAARS